MTISIASEVDILYTVINILTHSVPLGIILMISMRAFAKILPPK